MQKPLILLSNDDGYQAKGINSLIEMLRPIADLIVVAPDGGRSGFGCAITSSAPIHNRLITHHDADPSNNLGSLDIYACSGSPVDCVKLAFNILLPQTQRQVAMVVSGINHGDNSSLNTFYSGTMGAAFEGTHQGIPSVGFSLCDGHPDADFAPCAPHIVQIVKKVLAEGLPPFAMLNVNFPKGGNYKGVRLCRCAHTRWTNEIATAQHPNSRQPYYWLTGERTSLEPLAEDTDDWALEHGFVAITPQTLDTTHYTLLREFKL